MSVAWYIVLEQKIPALDPFVNGKALAHASKELDALTKQAGLRPLMEFFSASPAELKSLGVEGANELPTEQWFTAEDGLRTVRALIVEAEKGKMGQRILDDLAKFERVLEAAYEHGVRWHLAVDF